MKTELEQYYPHQRIEKEWNTYWLEKGVYHYSPNEKPNFTIVVPPPNITGILHLGHALNATIQDILARKARIDGYNVCWVPGSDHASIATEAKVLEKLKAEQNIDKKQLSRETFLQHAERWKEKHGNIIYDQLKKLGCSLDWSKKTFTMDPHYYQAVVSVFVSLYEQGLIYKGSRMIHWDVLAQTALSDEEVEYKEEHATLYYVKYVCASDETAHLLVATKRPETIMGDVALCVHPKDERYQHWIGKQVLVPLIRRSIPVITDESVDPAFGTGVLKITPAHAPEDYRIGQEHHLPIVQTFLPNGTLSEEAQIGVGKTIAEAKLFVLDLLKKEQLLEKTESYQTRIGYSQRTQALVEPFISTQWFMNTETMAAAALKAVREKNIQFFPEQRFENTYYHWMENVRDWCISRQLWWGHRIPAWYDKAGHIIVAENETLAYQKYQKQFAPSESIDALQRQQLLSQDEDCLDTWFSSWIWPIEVFDGITQKDNPMFRSAYPTSVLVTGHDILFFWVARMVMAGLHFTGQIPFRHVYFTGMVRDKQGRKMSKSLGNSPDLLQMIEDNGADALRFGVMIASPAGNDLLFDEESVVQGKNFTNKLWNVWKLIAMMRSKINPDASIRPLEQFANVWMLSQIDAVKKEVDYAFKKYRLSEALKQLYALLKNTFCNSYMEWVKVGKDDELSAAQAEMILTIWRSCLQLLHPYMPLITESLFAASYDQTTKDAPSSISDYRLPKDAALLIDEPTRTLGNQYDTILTLIREAKQAHQLDKESTCEVWIESKRKNEWLALLITKMAKVPTVVFSDQMLDGSLSIPYEDWQINLRIAASEKQQQEHQQKVQKDLEHQLGLLASIEKKLSNPKFLENAKPEVIALEKTKWENTQTRINALKKNLS